MPLITEPIKEVPEFVSTQLEQTVEHTNDIDKSDLITILIVMFILYINLLLPYLCSDLPFLGLSLSSYCFISLLFTCFYL
mgnify:CR=1 FL=1